MKKPNQFSGWGGKPRVIMIAGLPLGNLAIFLCDNWVVNFKILF